MPFWLATSFVFQVMTQVTYQWLEQYSVTRSHWNLYSTSDLTDSTRALKWDQMTRLDPKLIKVIQFNWRFIRAIISCGKCNESKIFIFDISMSLDTSQCETRLTIALSSAEVHFYNRTSLYAQLEEAFGLPPEMSPMRERDKASKSETA